MSGGRTSAGGGAGRERREPVVGDLAGLRLERPVDRSPPVRTDRRWWLAAVVLLGLLALGIALRQPLADRLWPQARVQQLVDAAGEALARGHLTAGDGSGARELYEAAAAIDPDRGEARAGLARVAEAALAQASQALAGNDFVLAHARLQLARDLSVPRAQADAFAAQLRAWETAHVGLDALLAQAAAAQEAGRLQGAADAALPLYARVLELQPGQADAMRGREDVLGAVLEQARQDLRGGDLAAAMAAIATVREYDPGHVDLPDTQARLTEELDTLRRRAEADLRRGRADAAAATWQRLLDFDGNDAGARDGLLRAARLHAAEAQRLAADFRFAPAQEALRKAQALAPGDATVAAAQAALERARRRHAQLQPAQGGRERVPQLLRQAAEAEARGDLLTPPGESAYDRLRAAQAIAPRDAQVRRAVGRLLPAARECFERGLGANDLARARRCLEAREALGEPGDAVAQARLRLAQRWLAIGEERLAGGQLEPARAALAAARSVEPGVAGATEFEQRLRTATGGP